MQAGSLAMFLIGLCLLPGCSSEPGEECDTREVCGNLKDDDCDGNTDEGCQVGACAADALDAIDYLDDLDQHPGCSREPSDVRSLEYAPADIPGFPCAAT